MDGAGVGEDGVGGGRGRLVARGRALDAGFGNWETGWRLWWWTQGDSFLKEENGAQRNRRADG